MEETPVDPTSGMPPVEPPPSAVIPWEDPTRPWPGALVETVRLMITSPRGAFERVPVRGDVLRPVIYALLLGWVGLFFTAVYELTLGSMVRSMMPAGVGQDPAAARFFYIAMIPFGPLYVALGLLLSSAILHVSLLVVGGAKNGYVATLRALCYTQSASIALVLPFCGSLLGSVGIIVLEVIGLSVLHRITIGKALVAVLIPVVVCCVCVSICFALFGAALMAGLKGMAP
jgi:Yip1-like protein